MSKFGKFVGVVGGIVGAGSVVAGSVYVAENPNLVKDYIQGNPTYTNQQMIDTKKEYENKIEKLENENSQEVTRLNALISANNTRITELEALNKDKEEQIATLNANISSANAQIETLQAENTAKDEEIESLNVSIEENNATILSLQQTNSEQTAQISSLQQDNSAKLTQIETLNSTIQENNTRIAELEQSEEDKTEEIAELQADNTAKASEIETLNASISANNSQIAELQASVESKNETIASLTNENNTQKRTIEELEAEKTANATTISELQSQNADLQSQLTTLNETITSNNAVISELESQVNTYEELLQQYVVVTYVVGEIETVVLQDKGTLVMSQPESIPDGYEFVGWSTTEDGSNIVTSDYVVKDKDILYAIIQEKPAILSLTIAESDAKKPNGIGMDYNAWITSSVIVTGSGDDLKYVATMGGQEYIFSKTEGYYGIKIKRFKVKSATSGIEREFIADDNPTLSFSKKIFTLGSMWMDQVGSDIPCFFVNMDFLGGVCENHFVMNVVYYETDWDNCETDLYLTELDIELLTYDQCQ